MKILIATPHLLFSEKLNKLFNKRFLTDIATTIEEALLYAVDVEYEVIVIDAGINGVCGTELCTKLRQKKLTTPTIVVSDVKEIDHRVAVLEAGADDFLPSPFSDSELIARVSSLARRRRRSYTPNILKVRDLVVDLDSKQVTRDKTPIPLRRKEFDILVYLMANKGRVLSRPLILQNAWEVDRENWHNTVDVHIKYLRDKVDKPFPTSQPLIKTVYGMGYRLD